MTQFKFKNLPNGFEFPITKHEIREFVKAAAADFELVEFEGISVSENKKPISLYNQSYCVCYLKAIHREDVWCFKLEVRGLRVERYEERRAEIAQSLVAEIQRWTVEKLNLPKTAPNKPCRASIRFDLTQPPEQISELSEWTLPY